MKICVIGTGPWPREEGAIVTGPSIRLRQFVEPLIQARHEVVVVMLEERRREAIPLPGIKDAAAFSPEEILRPDVLQETVDLSFTDAVFGVGSLMPAAAATRLSYVRQVPCWVDFFGDPMAELHASQLRQGGAPDTTARDHVWKLTREALLHADAFSTVSGPQRHALLGQLGLLGRYGNHWHVCRRVHEIPCAVPESWSEPAERPPFPALLRDRGLGENSRYVYFGGSWNVWLDESSMAAALEKALGDDPELYFVSCGIPTGPAGQQIHQSLMKPLERFRDRGRVIDLPPQSGEVEEAFLAYAGACLSLDRPIPEAELGSRNRLLAMVRWGARPVVSLEAGVETMLVAAGLAAGIDGSNASRAAKEILIACNRSAKNREEDRQAGLEWLRTVTFERTMEPAARWLEEGAPRWPSTISDGLLDRWAGFPADPEKLFGEKEKKKGWFFFS